MEREASTQPDSDNIDRKTNEDVDTTALESQLPTLDDDLRGVRPASIPYSTKLKPGSQFGSYLLVSVLGEGGFGQVWESIDQRSGRRLALKLLTSIHQAPKELIERFKQEGRLAASLNHPHCVYIFGADEVEGIPLITMEMMNGTLQDQLKAHGPMTGKHAVDSIIDIVNGQEGTSDRFSSNGGTKFSTSPVSNFIFLYNISPKVLSGPALSVSDPQPARGSTSSCGADWEGMDAFVAEGMLGNAVIPTATLDSGGEYSSHNFYKIYYVN